ncbi:hypothetical protein BJV78DRAFT_1262357 [Lactifluus subvellereus]|nr:hypothetical protein BJV78DRAFT_1262357 [Lactifluus subvellereus]
MYHRSVYLTIPRIPPLMEPEAPHHPNQHSLPLTQPHSAVPIFSFTQYAVNRHNESFQRPA